MGYDKYEWNSTPGTTVNDDGWEASVRALDKMVDDITKPPVHVYNPYTFTIADELFNLHDRQQLIPDRVIFNPPATIVFWKDGTKTVVKCSGGDNFDPEKGLAMATIRKIYGSRNKFLKVLEKGVIK